MQRPTLTNVRIRTPRDAMQVFNGVARGVIPLITRRLDVEERRAIVPGNVYVWEERSGTAEDEPVVLGMERWTDGVSWGPSRVRDRFLYYYEKDFHTESSGTSNPFETWNEIVRTTPGRVPDGSGFRPGSPFAPFRRRSESERLIKQTYSVFVTLPHDRNRHGPRKWHLTAYFSQERLGDLKTVDDVPGIGDVPVPNGWFVSARSRKTRRPGSGDSLAVTSNGNSMHPIHPPTQPPHQRSHRPSPPRSNSPPSPPIHRSHLQTPVAAAAAVPPPSTWQVRQYELSSSRYSCSPSPPMYKSNRASLVPLEQLQNSATFYPRRDASDETLLRLFTHASILD